VPCGHVEVDSLQAEGPLGVGEVQAAHRQLQRPSWHRQTAHGLGFDVEQLPQVGQRAQALLPVRQVPGDLVDLADKGAGDQEQRDELSGPQVSGRDQRRACQGSGRQQPVQEQPGPSTQPGGRLAGRGDPRVHHRGQLRAAPQQVGLTQAGTQVVPAGDSLLHSGRVVGPGGLLGHLASQHLRGQGPYGDDDEHGDQREQRPGRPPGPAAHDPHRAGTQQRAGQVPAHPSQQHTELVGVVVDPVQDLTDRGFGQHGERLVERRGQ